MIEIDTPHGQANAHLHAADEPTAALVLGHGAAGGVGSRDLVAVTEVARSEGVSVALVEQPYRVAGRRSPAPARQLDAAWTPSRLFELDEVPVPTLVVQGARDRFGIPPATGHRTVVEVPGDHSLRTDVGAVAAAVGGWLPGVVAQAARTAMPG